MAQGWKGYYRKGPRANMEIWKFSTLSLEPMQLGFPQEIEAFTTMKNRTWII